jgi:hypothetical protein
MQCEYVLGDCQGWMADHTAKVHDLKTFAEHNWYAHMGKT